MHKAVGTPLERVEGRLTVRGRARYSAEYPLEGLVHAVPVTSMIASSNVVGVASRAAEAVPSVLAPPK